ncbi:MAG TPA: HAD family hydrolase [Acidobacteriaceae bacterium]|nr:HAD family hydrolase [Acidobacteriaceae bacterium]
MPDSLPPDSIQMIAADLDGTLLSPHGQLSERMLAALRAVEAARIPIVFATGRRQSFAMQVLSSVGLSAYTVLITSNGAVTRTLDGALIERHLLPAETAQQLCGQLAEFRDALLFTFDRVGPGAMVVEQLTTLHRSIAKWVEMNAHEIALVTPLEDAFAAGESPVQGMICGTLERMEAAQAVLNSDSAHGLRDLISVHRTEYAVRDLSIVDLLPAECSKGRALARVATSLGIPAAQVLAIGDNMNDAEMLAWSGHPVVMANAAAELCELAKAKGWRFAASNEIDGAALVMEAVLAGSFSRQNSPSFVID